MDQRRRADGGWADGGWADGGRAPEGRTAAALGPAVLDEVALPARQRSIVAALVLHRAEGASTERMIDVVWGDRPPATARQSLQNQVARLRARFGADVVHTDAGGYRLGRDTDVAEFERSVEPCLARPGVTGAIRELDDALRLWRGTPYLDVVDDHEVEAERARLSELRALASERLAVARLVAGDVHRAAADLVSLTESDPYREQGWRLLMVALRLGGRRAEALAAYDRAAARFAVELRAKPSLDLQRLRARIDHDEVLDLGSLGFPMPAPGPHGCLMRRRAQPPVRRCTPAADRSA